MANFRGHLFYTMSAFLPVAYIVFLSVSTAPDRAEYLYYFNNPAAATRLEPGFVAVLHVFDLIYLPADIALISVVLVIISLYLQGAFVLMAAPSDAVVIPVLIFLLTIFVTPTFIQIRFGLAVGLVVLGYALMLKRSWLGILCLGVGCTFHIGVLYFAMCVGIAFFTMRTFQGKTMRIFALICLVSGPSLAFQALFASAGISAYYQLYFAADYENAVVSLSAIFFFFVMIAYLALRPQIDHTMFILFGGLGMLFLVLTSGFAVFHRLYFPAILIGYCWVIDEILKTARSVFPKVIVTVAPLALFPIAIYFTNARLAVL